MRHDWTAAEIGALSFGLATAAAGGLGLPRIVWWATLAVALILGLLALAGQRFIQRRWPGLTKFPLVPRSRSLTREETQEQMNRTIRREGKKVVRERQQREDSIEPTLLTGPKREELRALIAEGESIAAPMTVDLVGAWMDRSAQWLLSNGHVRTARRLRTDFQQAPFVSLPEVLADGLRELRVLLAVNLPTAFSLDQTLEEAVESWMEVQALPVEMRQKLREKHSEIARRLDTSR